MFPAADSESGGHCSAGDCKCASLPARQRGAGPETHDQGGGMEIAPGPGETDSSDPGGGPGARLCV